MTFGVGDFSRLAFTDWRLCFLALMTATPFVPLWPSLMWLKRKLESRLGAAAGAKLG